MTLPLDLILYIVIAAVLVIWLKNTLGTRHGEERERPNPFNPANQPPPAAKNADKAMPHLDIPDSALNPGAKTVRVEDLPRNTTTALTDQQVNDACRIDETFNLPGFVRNAQEAYAIILESYADDDMDALTDLTTPGIARQFKALITDRQTQGRRLNIEVQGVRACHIAALRLQGSIADIDLEIVADALMQEYDRDGILRGGHPDKTTELRDKWTFSRDLSQRDPTWRVSAIHDEIGA